MMNGFSFMSNKPSLLFKYRSIASEEEFYRLIDIVKNNRIFAPSYIQLNDPFEGFASNIKVPGWAGMGAYLESNEELPPIALKKQYFRIVSLSSESTRASLWAHYANNYRGVCLCFSTEGVFKNADNVEYNELENVWVRSAFSYE